jgi:capsular exopolysaccharide synthesis family protein
VDFKDLLRIAQRRWLTIAVMVALALGISGVMVATTTPVYRSNARVFISADVRDVQDAYLANLISAQRVQSYADLANSQDLLQRVIDRLNLQLTPAELAGKVQGAVVQNTSIISLQATDTDPHQAQRIAQADAAELRSYIGDVEAPSGKGATPIKATVVDDASFDANPVSPKAGLDLAVALLLGLVLGFGLAVVRELLDTTLKSPEAVEELIERPVMASVGFDPAFSRHPLLTEEGSHVARAEAFRVLRTNLQFADLDADPRSFVITSAVPGEGKTATSTNLAIALAQAGKRVLLVDADLRRPRAAELLGLESAVGLTTVLVGRSDLEQSIQLHKASGVYVLASGPVPPNPTEVLQSQATRDLLGKLATMFDSVIIDAPPLLPVADAAILASDADGAILVVRHGRTTKDQLRQATARLHAVGGRVFGVVTNMTPRRRTRTYGYGDGAYGYGSAPAPTLRLRRTDRNQTRAARRARTATRKATKTAP